MSPEEIIQLSKEMENQTKEIKFNVFKISWYMRGGVTSEDLFWRYSVEDRSILNDVIKENIEVVNKTGLPLV